VDVTADGTILIQNLKKQKGNAWTDHLDQEVSRSYNYTKAKVRSPIGGDKNGIRGFQACLLIYYPLTTCGTRALRPLVISKGYHTGIITSIHLNIMARQLEQKVSSAMHGFWLVEFAGISGPNRQAYWVW
jgi:hypothetical protein